MKLIRKSCPIGFASANGICALAIALLCLHPYASAEQSLDKEKSAQMETWITQLSSDNWKSRQEAMERLVNLGEDALPRLHHLAEVSTDDEVRTRAASAIGQIEENRAVGQTLVTLNLQNVPPAQAYAELARQARAPLRTEPANLFEQKNTKPVSLMADHEPLWKVLQSFTAQCDLEVTEITRNRDMGLGVTKGNSDWQDKPIVLSGPLLIRADRLSRVNTLRLKGGNPIEEFNISLTVFAEPKIKVMDYSGTLELEEAIDDLGHSLIPPQVEGDVPPNIEVFGNLREGTTSHWEVGATLHRPKGSGTKIARLKGTTGLQVQTKSALLDVPAASAKNLKRTVEGVRFLIKNVDAAKCEMSVFRDGRTDMEWFTLRMQLSAGEAMLKDEKGKVVARSQAGLEDDETPDGQRMDLKIRFARELFDDGSNNRESKKPSLTETHLVWEFPTEVRQLNVPFEFRDLPIP